MMGCTGPGMRGATAPGAGQRAGGRVEGDPGRAVLGGGIRGAGGARAAGLRHDAEQDLPRCPPSAAAWTSVVSNDNHVKLNCSFHSSGWLACGISWQCDGIGICPLLACRPIRSRTVFFSFPTLTSFALLVSHHDERQQSEFRVVDASVSSRHQLAARAVVRSTLRGVGGQVLRCRHSGTSRGLRAVAPIVTALESLFAPMQTARAVSLFSPVTHFWSAGEKRSPHVQGPGMWRCSKPSAW